MSELKKERNSISNTKELFEQASYLAQNPEIFSNILSIQKHTEVNLKPVITIRTLLNSVIRAEAVSVLSHGILFEESNLNVGVVRFSDISELLIKECI